MTVHRALALLTQLVLLVADQCSAAQGQLAAIPLPLPPPSPPPPAPSTFTVTLFTDVSSDVESASDISVTVTRSWAPRGADRFYALVQAGFYNESAFFRVVTPNMTGCVLTCGGIVQFGISGSRALNDEWLDAAIKDDPVTQSNTAGMVNYADAGPNTRSTELVFMLGDNTKQDAAGFAPFGKISTPAGLAVARKIFNPTPNNSGGIDQGKYIRNGNQWIHHAYPGVNFIVGAAVVKSAPPLKLDDVSVDSIRRVAIARPEALEGMTAVRTAPVERQLRPHRRLRSA